MPKKTASSPTPALQILQDNQVEYELIEYDADAHSPRGFALDTAQKLGIESAWVYKTLVTIVSGLHPEGRHTDGPVIAVVPANCTLNLKRLAAAAGGKHAQMMDRAKAQVLTGYVAGGISPLGTKTPLPVFLDEQALALEYMLVSGGKRGHSVKLNPADLAELTQAAIADIADPL